ncbi:MAG TPA: adenylate/guanylate cyclase domain-containing protein [Anaerolineales bacterium]|nr:adenylate/guanylate cyclase domain-containing protein [Anaerolineales bacterium]
MTLGTFLPQDRLRALTRDESLPDRARGSALFADISGFTHLTEALRESLGARRGSEELTRHLDAVYTALIDEVESYGGSVIDFAGDSFICWFDNTQGPAAARAVKCAFALQQAMIAFTAIAVPNSPVIPLALKVVVATGFARRFVVGDPAIHYIDTLAGTTVARISLAEHLAKKSDILVDEATVTALNELLTIDEWRQDHKSGERFAVALNFSGEPESFPLSSVPETIPVDKLRGWIHPIIYEREQAGQGTFLTEFRPCIAMFVHFNGIDYDSDDAEKQLDTFIRQSQASAEQFGGTLLQLTIGDKGSYAYINFGAFTTYEDVARRAVKTALALKKAVEGLNFLGALQIGITHGVMRVGGCGGKTRRAYSAMGDDVNLAARLMTNSAPGEILISGRLRKMLADEFEVEARPPMTMKGKAEPLPIFSVLGIKRQRSVRLQERAYALPMIGRKQEMMLFGEKIQSVLNGHGQIIGITGEAGMGKSRLVAEGIRLARKSNLSGYGGECQSDGVNTPYLVWQPIWNAFFDLDPLSPLRKQVRSLEGELEDRAPDHVDALPLLGTVLGLSLPDNDFTHALQPKDRKAKLETMLVHCIESAAREAAEEGGGLILVLEDLHWIDPVSFDLLELIAYAIQNLPVLILVAYRVLATDLQQQMFHRIEAIDHFAQIQLEELTNEEMEQVIRSKLFNLFPERGGKVSRVLIERITSRAQGNPFYAEELLNYLHDRGIDLSDVASFNELDLPTSLHSLILSRIDQLTASQQITIKVASIIGRFFRFEDLHNYYPSLGTTEKLKADLHELERLELTPLETPEPELAYLFKHIVTQEVGYESLAFATRIRLHGQYARYLESAYPDRSDQLAPQLAHHFEQAQISDKACFYLAKAGEQAAANYANEEALVYFNRALKLLGAEQTRMRFDILWKRERVYDLLGKRLEQRRDLEELRRLVGPFEEAPSLQAQLAICEIKLEIDAGDYAAAELKVRLALQEIKAEVQPDLFVDALLLEARVMFLTGQAFAAKPQLEKALSLAHTHHYVRGEYNALAQFGVLSWYGGDNAGAAALMEQSLELIRQAGDVRREIDILNNLGVVTKDMYRFTDALGYYERAQRIAKKIGDRSGEASLLNNMGRACFAAGDYVRADLYCAQAAALAAEVHDLSIQGLALHNRSEAYRQLGQYGLAKKSAEEAVKLLRSAGYRVGEADALENLGLIEFSLGKVAQAVEHVQHALTIAREASSRRVEVSALTRIGSMQLEQGQLEAAENAFHEAMALEQEQDSISMFEIQAGLAEVALKGGGTQSPEAAQSQVRELTAEILREPPTECSHLLPMGLYLTCIRAAQACKDPYVTQLATRAKEELQSRLVKITDPSLHSMYLNIPEHRDILNLTDILPSEK